MDKTDIILSMLLLWNSRLPYTDLAEKLGLSVNAVHKRIQTLREIGTIKTFNAKISVGALKAIHVTIFGESEAQHIEEESKKLQHNDSIYLVGIGSGKYLHVLALLRNISELDSCVDFVKEEAKMPSPTVGIIPIEELPASATRKSFQALDYRIIYALRNDSRKPIPEIADELGLSAKTVRRRLSTLIQDRLIDLSIEWYPDKSNDIMTLVHIHLKTSADRGEFSSLLTKEYSPNMLFFYSFSNLPNLVIPWFWTDTVKELQDICKRLDSEDSVEKIVPIISYKGYIFETWREKIVLEKGAPEGVARLTKDLRPARPFG